MSAIKLATESIRHNTFTSNNTVINEQQGDNTMKLINERQQAKIRYRYEVVASSLLATALVSITAFLTSPLAYGLFEHSAV